MSRNAAGGRGARKTAKAPSKPAPARVEIAEHSVSAACGNIQVYYEDFVSMTATFTFTENSNESVMKQLTGGTGKIGEALIAKMDSLINPGEARPTLGCPAAYTRPKAKQRVAVVRVHLPRDAFQRLASCPALDYDLLHLGSLQLLPDGPAVDVVAQLEQDTAASLHPAVFLVSGVPPAVRGDALGGWLSVALGLEDPGRVVSAEREGRSTQVRLVLAPHAPKPPTEQQFGCRDRGLQGSLRFSRATPPRRYTNTVLQAPDASPPPAGGATSARQHQHQQQQQQQQRPPSPAQAQQSQTVGSAASSLQTAGTIGSEVASQASTPAAAPTQAQQPDAGAADVADAASGPPPAAPAAATSQADPNPAGGHGQTPATPTQARAPSAPAGPADAHTPAPAPAPAPASGASSHGAQHGASPTSYISALMRPPSSSKGAAASPGGSQASGSSRGRAEQAAPPQAHSHRRATASRSRSRAKAMASGTRAEQLLAGLKAGTIREGHPDFPEATAVQREKRQRQTDNARQAVLRNRRARQPADSSTQPEAAPPTAGAPLGTQ